MNIVTYTHSMEIGGSQLNAIEMAAAVSALGHNLILVAEDGRLAPIAEQLGLERVSVSKRRRSPSPGVIGMLCNLVRDRDIDIIHGYEWPPILDGWFGAHVRHGTPVVGTVYSAAVAPFLPRSIPLIVGVENLRVHCREAGFSTVHLIEPPVNVQENSPAINGLEFRNRYGVEEATILVVIVCRLARELKLEGLLAACRVIGDLASTGSKIRLAIVGDGPIRGAVQEEAARANEFNGSRNIVFLTGELLDPRPAYAAADIVIGMGGSALRGMAFGKPLIVQGEAGFWKQCNQDSVSGFLEAGWYGLGDGSNGDPALRAALEPLLQDSSMRIALGKFGRQLVVERFSMEHAARTLVSIYEEAIAGRHRSTAGEVLRTALDVTTHNVGRRWASLRGLAPRDDFNSIEAQRKAASQRKS